MRRFFILIILITTLFNASYAQNDVTTFLGIPVDGYKNEMKQKLINKGFVYDSNNDCFDGEFNGYDVSLYIATNNNKVWRIMLADKHQVNETDIKIRFNKLCSQFSNNKKYTAANFMDFTIPSDENISYEMLVNKKRYEAAFCQEPNMEMVDTIALQQKIKDAVFEKFTKEQIDNPTEEEKNEIEVAARAAALLYSWELMEKKSVWFMINEIYGKYYISMFYDNEYNRANGEDL
ncbi:MAG: hypothetical protein IKB31_09730 [Bacteroidaceae bacterium]|nr:hypothetical protein [Bacteroidaceae bacterium]